MTVFYFIWIYVSEKINQGLKALTIDQLTSVQIGTVHWQRNFSVLVNVVSYKTVCFGNEEFENQSDLHSVTQFTTTYFKWFSHACTY